ncbi:MAG TPA: DUF2207 domain-containing protein [Candidatus Dormibacteraeota bacterium]|nr:DUF2207 domain-containing protein [Candidatus Dormibacteraeota bacterium]
MNRRIAVIWGVLCFSWVLFSFAGTARAQTEQILDYHSDIQLSDDGMMLVRETIQVVSAGQQIRHGIYRDFPTTYTDPFGNRYVVGFDLVGATCDGAPEETRVENRSNGVRIYLGSSKYFVQPGEHTYTVTYTTDRQLGFFRDHDELFWNVTGNGWIFPIEHASATVRLPRIIPADRVRLGGYTGPRGSMEQALTHQSASDGTFEFAATRPLGSSEGMTVLLIWPKGLIQPPTAKQKLNYLLHDNPDALIGGGGLAVIFLYYLLVWAAVGRDPKHGTIMALYEPPSGFSPGAIRFFERMGYDNKTFACAVVSMAVKGYLRIEEQGGTYTLYRAKSDPSVLSADERAAANILFEGRNEIWLHNEHHTIIAAAIAALKKSLKSAELKTYFVKNSGFMIPAALISLVVILWMASIRGSSALVMVAFLGVWLTGWSAAVAGLVIACVQAWKASFEGGHATGGLAAKAFGTTLVAVPFAGFEVMGLGMLVEGTSIFIAVTLIGAVALHIWFHYLLKAPTRAGQAVLDKIDGFKMFLGAVEGDPIRRAMAPEKTPEVFEKFLPYAIALGVEKAWAEKFSGVIGQASAASGSGANGYAPGWYSGPGWSDFGAAGFASSLGGSFASAISSSSSAPGSSGGGSGGSGGGGGGGGGGGW